MVSICTAKVCNTKNSAFAPHGVVKCSLNLAQKKLFPYTEPNQIISMMEAYCFPWEVRTTDYCQSSTNSTKLSSCMHIPCILCCFYLNQPMHKHALHIILDTQSVHARPPHNINKGLYMQPQVHTACTRSHNVEQISFYH